MACRELPAPIDRAPRRVAAHLHGHVIAELVVSADDNPRGQNGGYHGVGRRLDGPPRHPQALAPAIGMGIGAMCAAMLRPPLTSTQLATCCSA